MTFDIFVKLAFVFRLLNASFLTTSGLFPVMKLTCMKSYIYALVILQCHNCMKYWHALSFTLDQTLKVIVPPKYATNADHISSEIIVVSLNVGFSFGVI